MNLRIQTYGINTPLALRIRFEGLRTDYEIEGTTAIEALEKGLKDVQDLCDVVATKFWDAREEFTNSLP